MNTKKIIIPLASLVLVSQVIFISPAFAQTSTPAPTHENFFQGLVTFLSGKFGLDKTQVQSAISDYQKQNKPNVSPRPSLTPDQIQAKEKTRLDKLVIDGKITSAQEQAILDELTTLRTKYNPDSFKNLTQDDRKTKMQEMQNEIKTWATAQGIDPKYIMPMMRDGPGRMGMHRGGFGNNDNWGPKPSVTPAQ